MGRRINLLSKRERKTLARNMWAARARKVERAAEILEEEFENFLREARDNTGSGVLRVPGMANAESTVEVVGSISYTGRSVKEISVYIDHPVFNILDEGTEEPLGRAEDWGHKAWPIVTPRRVDFGSVPMTQPNSLELAQASSDVELIFRPEIRRRIMARNFTRLIYERAQNRIDAEDLGVQLKLTDR